MLRSVYKKSLPVLVLLMFGIQVVLLSPDSYAQGHLRVYEDIGGGGTTGQTQDSGGSTTTLIIVGGIVIGAILLYTLVLQKDKSVKEEKQDSTSSQSILLKSQTGLFSGKVSETLRKVKEIPVNLYLGYREVDPVLPERKFVMGISYNF